MFKIERNAAKLNTLVNATVKGFIKSNEMGHIALISAMVHAAEHGQPAPLNNLIEGLREHELINVVQNINAYITRIFTLTDDGGKPVLDATGKLQKSDVVFLQFAKKKFSTINDTPDERARFIKLAEEHLINPSNMAKFAPFYKREALREVKEFTDKNVLAQLKSIVAKIHGETQMIDSLVSRKLATLIETVYEEAEKIVSTGQEEPKRNVTAQASPKSKVQRTGQAAPASH